jgi:hypothetical protein
MMPTGGTTSVVVAAVWGHWLTLRTDQERIRKLWSRRRLLYKGRTGGPVACRRVDLAALLSL